MRALPRHRLLAGVVEGPRTVLQGPVITVPAS
jgi:hypothetical protein